MKNHIARILLFAALMSLLFAQSSSTVYITEHGQKYHTHTCRTIARAKTIALTKADAEARGYTACKICTP